jgi:hypothetical protein
MSAGKPAGDRFTKVAKKHRGDIRAVTSSENNKAGKKSRIAMYGVRNSSFLPIFSPKKGSKLRLYLFHDFSRNSPRVTMKTP